jgi:hypothetical protein
MDMFPNAGSGAVPEQPPANDGKMIDLQDKINMADCYTCIEASGFSMSNLFIGDS